jgi:hypothetical protein
MREENNMDHESTIAEEVAEEEFARFLETMDLVPADNLDDEDRKGFEDCKRRFIAAVRAGTLVVNEKGEPVFTPGDGRGPITFHEPKGASFIAMDTKKRGHDVAKSLAAMADMTQQTIARFSAMPNRDLRVCQAIQILFLV